MSPAVRRPRRNRPPAPAPDGPPAATPAARKAAPAWAWVLGTWFGSGLSPVAPGTAGTLATLPLAWALGRLPAWGPWNPWCLAAALALFLPAVAAAGRIEAALGRHDPGAAVVDETVGTLLTMAFLPGSAFADFRTYAAAFLLFRILDVWKPGPVGRSQSLPGGWGIVVDDALAGLLGAPVLTAAALLWRF